jgi:pumilio RNA-binding family
MDQMDQSMPGGMI